MKFKSMAIVGLVALLTLTFSGCGGKDYSDYAQAVKEQNKNARLEQAAEIAAEKEAQRQHELKMAALTAETLEAVAGTTSLTDDVMAPLMIMILEDKWNMARATASTNKKSYVPATIKAPETTGELIQKSTGAILGIAGIALGIVQSNNMEAVATAGIAGAGAKISGSNNTVGDDNNKPIITITDTVPDVVESE